MYVTRTTIFTLLFILTIFGHAFGQNIIGAYRPGEIQASIKPKGNTLLCKLKFPQEITSVGSDPDKGVVYVGLKYGSIISLDAKTGSIRWVTDIGGESETSTGTSCRRGRMGLKICQTHQRSNHCKRQIPSGWHDYRGCRFEGFFIKKMPAWSPADHASLERGGPITT